MFPKLKRIWNEEGASGITARLFLEWRQIRYRINRIRYRIKLPILRLLRASKIKSRYGVYLAPNYGDVNFKFFVCGPTSSYKDIYWNRISSKKDKFIYLDIGANLGLYSLCAAKNRQCVAVYAFEPVAKTYELLTKNIIFNSVQEKCTLVRKAVSNESGITKIKTNEKDDSIASMASHSVGSGIEEIVSIDGKDLSEVVKHDGSVPIVVKIDVEGFEKSVILGLIDSNLMPQVTEIFYEVDERWVKPKELDALLREAGFSTFKKVGADSIHYDILATK